MPIIHCTAIPLNSEAAWEEKVHTYSLTERTHSYLARSENVPGLVHKDHKPMERGNKGHTDGRLAEQELRKD